MADAKIELKLGAISFSGEGPEKWVAEQLDKILEKAPDLISIAPVESSSEGEERDDGKNIRATLAKFLQDKDARASQVQKFLATSVWLQKQGKNRLKTSDVTGALKGAKQNKLKNPSDCLNKNVSKGFCEKDGSDFFVTDEGIKKLGFG